MAEPFNPIETEPWEDVVTKHRNNLRNQLAYLEAESEYYQQRFDEWGIDVGSLSIPDDFRDIPFTTKQDERESQAKATAEQPLGHHQAVETESLNRTISSSGTTGKPTYFGLTSNDRDAWNEVLQRCFHTVGIRPSDTVIFGAGQTMIPGGAPFFEALTLLEANVVPAGGESTDRLLKTTKEVAGDVMWTTTSHIRYLNEHFEDVLGISPSNSSVSKLVGGASPGIANPKIRQQLYDTWDADVVREIMGLGDIIGCMWAECEEEDGMHYHAQGYAHVELIDPDTGDVKEFNGGVRGELVYTPLRREATPLLRFRSGDYVLVTGTQCSCGRTSPRIRCIGRTDDMLIYKGMNVFPTAIRDVVAGVDGATPNVRVVLPHSEKVNFEKPIPIRVARDSSIEVPDDHLVDDLINVVRERLKVRVNPSIVDEDEIQGSQYKTNLTTTSDK